MATTSTNALLNELDLLSNSDEDVPNSLPPDLLRRATAELQEKPEWRSRDVQALRQMILTYSRHLTPCQSSRFLLRFLRARKFDYDNSLELLAQYYAARVQHPEILRDLIPTDESSFSSDLNDLLAWLPSCDYLGRRVLCIRLGKWFEVGLVDEILRLVVMSLEAEIVNDYTQVFGISVIVDMTGISGTEALQNIKPSMLRKPFAVLQDAFPCRLKALHFVNEPAVFDGVLAVMKPFMKEKLRNRIHCHGANAQTLLSHVDRDNLPDFINGGTMLEDWAALARDWRQHLREARAYFARLASFGYAPGYAPEPNPASDHGSLGAFGTLVHTYKRLCVDTLN